VYTQVHPSNKPPSAPLKLLFFEQKSKDKLLISSTRRVHVWVMRRFKDRAGWYFERRLACLLPTGEAPLFRGLADGQESGLSPLPRLCWERCWPSARLVPLCPDTLGEVPMPAWRWQGVLLAHHLPSC